VPNGDERDKDVAAAIRYAADHGAQIINMSFGKGYSPQKPAVDSAVRYAEARGVLLVHAGGERRERQRRRGSYPTPPSSTAAGDELDRGGRLGAAPRPAGGALLELRGAHGGPVRAGSDIYSTLPGGKYGRNSGTSMAAPVVSGVAALLMAYFPP
jgi:subtilisin family serine protease